MRSVLAQTGPTQIGVAPAGQRAFELVGKLDQSAGDFAFYGCLSYVAALADAALFADQEARSETTAHFTFSDTATLTAHSVIGNVFVVDAAGTLNLYAGEAPAGSFDTPASFVSGDPIATIDVRIQNVLNVQSPNQGIATGETDSTQKAVSPFTLSGKICQFGQTGLRQRISFTGQGTRTDADLPRASIVLAGNSVVAG